MILFFSFFFALFTSTYSQAKIVLEPSLLYQAGKIDQGPIEGNASLIGPSFSVRAGYVIVPKIELGLEALYGELEQEYEDDPQVIYGATASQIGAYLAGNFNICRTWVGFYPMNQLDIPSRDQKFTGSALKIGVGIPVISNFNVNLDYTLHSFMQLETSLGTFDVPYNVGAESIPFDASTYTLSISYILKL